MTGPERRDLECRLRALGIDVRPGMFDPLEAEQLTRSPAAASSSDRAAAGGPVLTGVIRRQCGEILRVR